MIEICLAQEGDAPALAALEKESFSHPWSENAFLTLLKEENSRCVILREGTELLGYLTLTMVLDRAQINTVAVSSARRRQGLGRRLLEEGIRLCRAAKMSAMELEVRAGNLAALTLYRTLGFMEVGRRKGYYRDPPEDAVLMDLLL